MIVSAPDFKGKLTLAQRSDPATLEVINDFIAEYEPKYLSLLLGAELYTSLTSGLAEDPVLQKWTDLVNKFKTGLLDYIYWYYRENNVSSTTDTGGESITVKENAESISPASKMIARWNEMVDINIETINFINAHQDDYGAYYNQSWIAYCGTLYGFGAICGPIPNFLAKQNEWDI